MRARAVHSPRGRLHRPVALAALVALIWSAVSYAMASPQWWGWSSDMVNVWIDAYLGILLMGATVGAWVVLPVFSRRLSDRITLGVRERSRIALRAAATVVLWMWGAGLLLIAGAFGVSAVARSLTGVSVVKTVLWIVAGLVIIAFAVVLGVVLSALVKHVTSVILAPLAVYVVYLVPAYTLEPPTWGDIPISMGYLWYTSTPSLLILVLRVIFWVSMVGLFVWGVLSIHRVRAIVSLAVASSVFIVASSFGAERDEITGALDVDCVPVDAHPAVELCGIGIYAQGLPRHASILSDGLDILPDGYVGSTVFADPDAMLLGEPDDFLLASISRLRHESPTNLADRGKTLVGMGAVVLGEEECTDVTPGDDAMLMLHYWWTDELGLDLDGGDSPSGMVSYSQLLEPEVIAQAQDNAHAFAALTYQQRLNALQENRDDILTCEATVDALL